MSSVPVPRKSLAQHWLTDEASLQAICRAASLSPTDTILEIGPGMGHLTTLLAERVARVVAVEVDNTLLVQLAKRVPANVELIHQDILQFDLTSLPPDYKIVANIPYYLTSHLIRLISESINPPSLAVLLIQKEVADRVNAQPGAMSLLSVSAQFYWETSIGQVIKANLFTPPPKVDSQILILKRRNLELFPGIDTKIYFQLVKAGYAGRRKTLLNSLSGGLRLPKAEVAELLTKSGIDPTTRAQNLSLKDWYRLYQTASPLFAS